jgi:ribose-phosphate pyrophosphokinase
MNGHVKFFTGQASEALATKIAVSYKTTLGQVKLQKFSDGEFSPYFEESIRGCDVFLIQSTMPPSDNLMELLLLIDAAKRASAHSITVVMPYYGFARQDRKDKPRVSIAAKLVANLLVAAGATRVITMDLHAAQIQGFFDIPVDNLMASTVFAPYIKELNLPDLTFAAPDMGGAPRARAYAKYFNADIVICDKVREKANEVGNMTVIGDVVGKNVVILDDMVDTAGTLCKAAATLLEKGAKSVRACCTHPVLSGKAYENIEKSSLIELITTDTIPLKGESSKIKVLSVADLFAQAIERIYNNDSVNGLFLF